MEKLFDNYKQNLNTIKKEFDGRDDLIIREIKVGKTSFALFYLLGLSDTENLSKLVVAPIINHKNYSQANLINTLEKQVLYFSEISQKTTFDDAKSEILKGKAILFVNNCNICLSIQSDKHKERSIAEPPTNAVIKGPRRGFVENLKTNLASIKTILHTTHLKTINLEVGKYTKTAVAIMYLDGIADNKVVKEIETKIKNINIDGIIDSYYIGQFLETRKTSIFKQVGISEKPDIVCAKMLEGRVAIIVDGSPMVLTLPFLFYEDLQSSNDYYSETKHVSFVRIIRLCSLFVTILLPGLYIAIELHHYKTIPLKYLITILNTTQGLPLTPLLEMMFVLLLFEILYEASLRMPRYLGQAMSIVGALILGDTAVKAGIVSPPSVMFMALSSISLYVIPDQAPQLSLTRLIFLLAGGLLGFYGITIAIIFALFYFSDFDAYGTPYLSPLSPLVNNDLKDYIIKTDLVNMKTRPKSIPNHNRKRLK